LVDGGTPTILAREVLCNTRLDCQAQSLKFEPCLTGFGRQN